VVLMYRCNHQKCRLRRKMTGANDGASASDLRQVATAFRLTTGETLAEASASGLLVLVFLRHFGCTFTRQILGKLGEIESFAQSHDARLVLVHMLKSGGEIRYLGGHGDVSRIADPRCDLYRAFGLGKGGPLQLFGPRVWWLGFVSIFKGCGVGHLAGNALQMPGTFLFRDGEIIAAQRAHSAADLPDLPKLFEAVAHTNESP
jgi:hypothetical protein